MSREPAAILADLIAFPTLSVASNLALLDYVEAAVAPFGGRARRFVNGAGDKANLLVSIGPDVPGGLVFSGHTDVVPTVGQAWTGDPFTLRRMGSRLVGRGTADMKGFIACCLAALPRIAGRRLAAPIHLAFSYDEEVGCTGVGSMTDWLGQSGLAPRLAVIGEPSDMQLVEAHKGGLIGWATVDGKPGHSSQPDRYVNAVMVAARLVTFIDDLRREMKTGPLSPSLDPPWSTIQVNQIQGGTHGNIVAEQCRFFWEMRIVPGASPDAVLDRIRRFAAEELEPAMRAVDGATGIRFDVQARIPALTPNRDAALEGRLLGLLGQEAPRGVPFGSEAGIFQEVGIPAVIIGPGEIAQAHQPDESIEATELDRCVEFLVRLAAG